MRDFRFYAFREIRSRFRYDLTSYLDYRIDNELGDYWHGVFTRLPAFDNPKTKELAQSIRQRSDSDREFMANVMRLYATGDYAYTLKPTPVSGDTIDAFLFDTRRGFCEHFAGSFVYLMRAGNVPARVVVGYQ
ncbi:MAG: transglutaminase-like domain-containing protein, partial [Proteobacteria bacterium]|nr:transglutaminase-like domain-containing protein [Pseudomonadota bacterium]